MKIHTQPNAELQKLATLIQPMAGVAMLTSQDPDGALVSRPMAPLEMDDHGDLETDRGHIKRLWSPLARPWFPEGTDSGNLALLKFTPSAAEYWDAVDTKMVHLFATAVSVIAARPIGMGEHGHIDQL